MRDKLNYGTLQWLIGILFMAGIAYSQVQSIPKLADKIQVNEKKIAVLETQFLSIKEDLGEIKSLLRRGR